MTANDYKQNKENQDETSVSEDASFEISHFENLPSVKIKIYLLDIL
jgi:hypothetical protein